MTTETPSSTTPSKSGALAQTQVGLAAQQGNRAACVAFWAASLLMPLPMLISYFVTLWRQTHYQYFPALIIAVGLLVVARWDRKLRLPDSLLAWALYLFALAAYGGGTLLQSPWFVAVGWVAMLGSWLRTHDDSQGGWLGLLYLWPSTWLLVRLPVNLDIDLITWLQRVSSQWSSYFLDFLRVPHFLQGVVITLPEATLFVEEACSGVQSVFSLLFCGFLLVAWLRRSPLLLPLYAVAGIFWAGTMNVFRIVVIAVARHNYDYDLSSGWQHDMLGFITLGLAIGLFASTDRLFRVIFFPVPSDSVGRVQTLNPLQWAWNAAFAGGEAMTMDSEPEIKPRRKRDWIANVTSAGKTANWLLASAPIVLLLLLLAPQSWMLINDLRAGRLAVATVERNALGLFDIDPIWLPPESLFQSTPELQVLAYDFVRDGDDPTLGRFADVWSVRIDGMEAKIVVSQTYIEVHDLTACYRNAGWSVLDRRMETPAPSSGPSNWSLMDLSLRRDANYANVLFSGIYWDASPAPFGQLSRIADRWRMLRGAGGATPFSGGTGADERVIMVQLVAFAAVEFTPAQKQLLTDLHNKTRIRLQEALANSLTQSK